MMSYDGNKKNNIGVNDLGSSSGLNIGIRNRVFFLHASTIQRHDRNKLVRIKDDENAWHEGQNQIMQAGVLNNLIFPPK